MIDDHCKDCSERDLDCEHIIMSAGFAPGHHPYVLTHEQVESELDKVLKPTLSDRYNAAMFALSYNHPRIYKALISLGVKHSYMDVSLSRKR